MTAAVRWLLAVAVLTAGVVLVDDDAVAKAAVRRASTHGLVDIGRLAGARGSDDAPIGKPVAVEVVQEGGPMWIGAAVADAVDDDAALMRADGPHRLHVEVVADPPAYAIRLALWRRGWSVGAPDPLVVHAAPWVAFIAMAFGALALIRGRSVALSLAIAAVLAQVGSLALPWPTPAGTPALTHAWRNGPLGIGVVRIAEELPDLVTPIGIGIVVACLVLVAFDHRRSRGRGGWLVLAGIAAAVAMLAWIEAALRVAVGESLLQWPGWLAAIGAGALWWIAWRSSRRA